jgi:AcrR family transcriptional regulator
VTPPFPADSPRPLGRAAPLPPAERREAIITQVLPLLASRGASVTSRELALAAGVAEGTIFKVFADKDDLVRSAIERAVDAAPTEQAIAALDPLLPFETRLVQAAALLQRRLVDIWNLMAKFGPIGVQKESRRFPDSAATTALFASAASAVRVSPEEAARQFRALVVAFSHPMLNDPPPDPAELVEFFLHGLGRRG